MEFTMLEGILIGIACDVIIPTIVKLLGFFD